MILIPYAVNCEMSLQTFKIEAISKVKEAFENSSLEYMLRLENIDLWQESCKKLEYCPIQYENVYVDYQLAYQRYHGGFWYDFSVLILNNNKVIGIWPITLSLKDNLYSLTANGSPVLEPLFFNDTSKKLIKSSSNQCIDLMLAIKASLSINQVICLAPFTNKVDLSCWQTIIMHKGASTSVDYNLYIDLQQSLDEIKSNFRKSYKSLIDPLKHNYSLEIFDASSDKYIWNLFQKFHSDIAGKITRSQETWDLQYSAIKHNMGFLIYLLDESQSLVGGAFIMHSQTEGLYFTGAYDRSLSHKPLSHIIQFQAIKELKSRGCRWYKLGHRHYQKDRILPTDKEIAISFFKEGFSSQITPSFNLQLD
jgi:FemAB family protein